MKRVRLGKTNMYVNTIGLGCMGLSHASGLPTPKEEAVEILRKAHDMGYDFYDTAECYTGVNPDGSIAYNEEVSRLIWQKREAVLYSGASHVNIHRSVSTAVFLRLWLHCRGSYGKM